MKNTIAFLVILFFSLSGVSAQQPKLKPKADMEKAGSMNPVQYCADPAVVDLEFRVITRRSTFQALVGIEAVVKNLGGRDFVSSPGQQSIQIYEQVPGGAARLVKQKAFTRLDAGRAIRVIYKRDWDSSSPAEGEFPPTYSAIISYDPDIGMDANKQNDDCNLRNNAKERSGSFFNEKLQ